MISEEDSGVKTWKKKLLASVKRRMGDFEDQEIYALSTILDPK